MSGHSPPRIRELAPSRVLQGALLAAGVGASLNALVYVVARAAGVTYTGEPVFGAPDGVVGLKNVVGASIVWVLPATLVLLLMNRFLKKPTKIFVIVAAGFGTLSLVGPLTFPGAPLGTKAALCVAHVICAIVITASLVVRGRRAPQIRASEAQRSG
jgi:Family of unknown function (DUF6069)